MVARRQSSNNPRIFKNLTATFSQPSLRVPYFGAFLLQTTSLFRHNLVERLVDARPFDVVGRFLHNLLKGLRYTCD
jgi:hypothetical protein